MVREIGCDVAAARDRDPAARGVGTVEILSSWAGVQALLSHRFAHALYDAGIPLAPRTIAFASRAVTGVEIHPAAQIGADFFIDHGSGVVIGETAEIGERVTLYQGVTLGGTGFARGKRHPTVEDDVTIGSGAKLLGPVTVGHGAKVGANTVVIEDVPANSTVVGNPGHPVRVEGRRPEGPDADWIHLPDPIADAIKGLSERMAAIEGRLAELDGRAAEGEVKELRPKQGPSLGRRLSAPASIDSLRSERWASAPATTRERSRWTDLGTDDAEGAKAFYGELFGWGWRTTRCRTRRRTRWRSSTARPWARSTSVARAGAARVALLRHGRGCRRDRLARRAELGGTPIAEPMDVMEAGRMAVLQDPTGAVFAIWQPRDSIGAELVNDPGAMTN